MDPCDFCGRTTHTVIDQKAVDRGYLYTKFCQFPNTPNEQSLCRKRMDRYELRSDWSNGIPFAITGKHPDFPQIARYPCGYCGLSNRTIYNPKTPRIVLNYPYFCRNATCFKKCYYYMRYKYAAIGSERTPFILTALRKNNLIFQYHLEASQRQH